MPIRGHVSRGAIVLDEPVKLPEGTHVTITVVKPSAVDSSGVAGSWVDDRSAKEIAKEIRSARQSRK